MKVIKYSETEKYSMTKFCKAIDYLSYDKDINGAIIILNGRYPTDGLTLNKKSKELVYIMEGIVILTSEGKSVKLEKGDQVIINPGEKYCWKGDCKMLVVNTPAWSSEQTENIL